MIHLKLIQFDQEKIQTENGILENDEIRNSNNSDTPKLRESCENLVIKGRNTNIFFTETAVYDSAVAHSCDRCDFKTRHISSLKTHIRSIHEGEIFPCAQCEYKATEKSRLTKHIKSIHEGKRYPCDQCNVSTKQHSKKIFAHIR